MPNTMNGRYSPLYFLAAVGAGGLVVTFFMYLMFWIPHPGQPVPIFEDIQRAFTSGSIPTQIAIVLGMMGIAVFGFLHYRLLFWNLGQLTQFRKTEAYTKLLASNGETQLKAVPLTLAMSVNVAFIIGLVFVPKLWLIVEYLFPAALAVFSLIGLYALSLLAKFFGRVLVKGGFDLKANNSFAQLLPAFALSMVAVGLAAPAALSANPIIVGISIVLATFFVVAALVVSVVALVLGFSAMLQNGTAPEAAPTLMVVVPIMTVLGIAILRMNHGLHVHFDVHAAKAETLVLLAQILSVQILFAVLGWLVLSKQNYVKTFLSSNGQRSAGSYALVCPGVALSVMIHFFVNKGLVASGMIAKFGVAYWSLTTPALILQAAMIVLVFSLNARHFGTSNKTANPVPAE